ncbi:MAG TPA: PstS family phosphate ABC transporter substrate-binding protein [Geminocystis sp. M7585_C2015_104]|nr:PstS family phosphate ABC transporter substrate-binding protein [Geminocystis sp. M7585_C2015_104]
MFSIKKALGGTTVLLMLLGLGLGWLSACASSIDKFIYIDGSSTVYPITDALAKQFKKQESSARINVAFSGSLAGFRKFCNKETDINNSSVPIPKVYMEECKKNGVKYIELPVAFDALTVVINRENNWAEAMKVEELKKIWQPEAQGNIIKWNQVRPFWPDRRLTLFGPGRDSGTFEFFTTAIVGRTNSSRNDYVYSEDDEAIANGVMQDPNALGYFGYAYYKEHQDRLKAVAIDSGNGPVYPSEETVKNNTYRPLTRPLFIYVNAKTMDENNTLKQFVEFYLTKAATVAPKIGYIPLPLPAYQYALINVRQRKIGTVFNGEPVLNASIEGLLSKSYASQGKDGYVY